MESRLDVLRQGLAFQGLELESSHLPHLLEYVDLLDKWNKVYNLTAVRDKHLMLTRHILDSLTLMPFVSDCSRIADLGSGGGLPGIPLAICFPTVELTLIDSNSKKTRFLTHVINTLGLQNARVLHTRIEDYYPDSLYDCLVSRAFAAPDVILSTAAHLCDKEARLVLMAAHLDGLDLSGNQVFSKGTSDRVKVYRESSTRNIVTFLKEKHPRID